MSPNKQMEKVAWYGNWKKLTDEGKPKKLRDYPSRGIYYASAYEKQLETYNSSPAQYENIVYEQSGDVTMDDSNYHSVYVGDPPKMYEDRSKFVHRAPVVERSARHGRRFFVSPQRRTAFYHQPQAQTSPQLELGALELQALQIKYYKMKLYKTELEIRSLDPNFVHRIFDEDATTTEWNEENSSAGTSSGAFGGHPADGQSATYQTPARD